MKKLRTPRSATAFSLQCFSTRTDTRSHPKCRFDCSATAARAAFDRELMASTIAPPRSAVVTAAATAHHRLTWAVADVARFRLHRIFVMSCWLIFASAEAEGIEGKIKRIFNPRDLCPQGVVCTLFSVPENGSKRHFGRCASARRSFKPLIGFWFSGARAMCAPSTPRQSRRFHALL